MMTVSRSINSPWATNPGTCVRSVRRPTIRSERLCATVSAGVFSSLMLKRRCRFRFSSSNRSSTASTIASASVPPMASTVWVRLSALNRSGTRAEPASVVPSSVTPAGASVPAAVESKSSFRISTAVSASAFCKVNTFTSARAPLGASSAATNATNSGMVFSGAVRISRFPVMSGATETSASKPLRPTSPVAVTYSTITLRAACNACASAPPAFPPPPPCWAWAGLMTARIASLMVSARASAVANSSATTSIRETSPLSPRSRSRTSLRTSANPLG
ncbi:hypothetical protein LzC2_17840 [Planctomycetes bacterium LzC2]|uniref:Cell division GTPase n=1 Tax=Alienimonas chondri TaxID=2681879 RepID=A0ABX1VF87_9PLAN|nr:hypothetical protein [Alienimonas chondri]